MKLSRVLSAFLMVIAFALAGCTAGEGAHRYNPSSTSDTGNGGGGY